MPIDRASDHASNAERAQRVSQGAHAVQPEVVRESTTLESFASTLRTWSATAPFDPLAPLSPSASPVSPRVDTRGGHDAHDGGWDRSGRERESHWDHRSGERGPDAGERVAWARWDELVVEGGEGPRRILILAYKNGGVAVWDCSSLDTWVELLNLPTLDCAFDSQLRRQFPRGTGVLSSAAVLPPPLLPAGPSSPDPYAADRPLVAFSSSSSSTSSSSSSAPSSTVFLYSLRNHRITSTFSVPGLAQRILPNRRSLVLSTISPPALHLFRADDLSALPQSPLSGTDLARSPFDGAPVFDLGQGGRLLAFATDRPLLSSRLDRLPARPGAGILAHRGFFDADGPHGPGGSGEAGDSRFAATATEAAQAGGEVARRAAEGVLSGVKAIGGAGMNYWMQRGASGRGRRQSEDGGGAREDDVGAKGFSRSAPLPASGFGRRMSASAMTMSRPAGEGSSSTAGTIMVVDLLSPTTSSGSGFKSRSSRTSSSGGGPSSPLPFKVVAHFRPYAQPLALLSFSPSSTSLLTAPAGGHAFDVFELKPSVRVGVSATASPSSSALTAGGTGKVWHRYRLSRGFTSARASAASWSADGRFVGVSTSKGTAHIYALDVATGGQPNLERHFDAKVANGRELAPLSVQLGTGARVRTPKRPAGEEGGEDLNRETAGGGAASPAVVFLPKADSAASAFAPAPSSSLSGSRRPRQPAFQDLAVFHSSAPSGCATLHRLQPVEAPAPPLSTLATAAEGTLAAASRGDVGKLATTAVSGLSQLMKRGTPVAGGAAQQEGRWKEWAVKGETLAGWRLGREKGWGEVRQPVGESEAEESSEEGVRRGMLGLQLEGKKEVTEQGVRYVSPHLFSPSLRAATDVSLASYSAFAEIETFSRSPFVLPRSIYQSQQFDFFSLPVDHASTTKKGNFALPLRRLEMRSEVQLRAGDGALSSDVPVSSPSSPISGRHYLGASRLSSSSFEPASFDQPIKTAMQSFFETESMLAPGSPKLPAPGYPNGVPGKHGSWRDSLPVFAAQARQVAPAALEGFGKVRQGLGRVRLPAVPAGVSGMIPLGRNNQAPTAPGPIAAYSSSISFEDDDAVFAERLAADDAASAGTACTSEDDLVRKTSGGARGAGDEEDWGWDDGEEGTKPAVATPLSGAEPFEEEFDDLDLELPGFSPSAGPPAASKADALALTAPSPLTLDPVDDSPVSSSIPAPSALPRHLAPHVYPAPSHDDGNSSSAPSSLSSTAGSGSGFDTAAGLLGTSPPILDRPGSALSGIGILAPSPAPATVLAVPTNGPRSASPASSGASGGGKKKKRR
ncbi:hypothetical protein JCM10213_004794 [Rhodosporidiobolus nylandii]